MGRVQISLQEVLNWFCNMTGGILDLEVFMPIKYRIVTRRTEFLDVHSQGESSTNILKKGNTASLKFL